ncbi:MAG: hypothetical protein WBP81_18055 [Solirubrobacteraceae bacterium]
MSLGKATRGAGRVHDRLQQRLWLLGHAANQDGLEFADLDGVSVPFDGDRALHPLLQQGV